MAKGKLILLLTLALIVVIIIVGRMLRQSEADALQETFTGIVSVKGLVVQPEPYVRHIEGSGVLVGNKEAMIAAETGGRVVEMKVDVGDYVRSGDALVRLDDELYQLESDRANIAYDKAKLDLGRMEKLYAEKSISESDLENARLMVKGAEVQYRLARKTYNDATIRAPFSGDVAARYTEVGQMVERGMPVVQLVDVSSLKLTVQIAEADVKLMKIGETATIIVDAVGDTVAGKVSAIGSRAVTGTRTFPVELRLPGASGLRSGMFARAVITTPVDENGLLLPRNAILPDMGKTVVFVARGDKAEKIPVRTITESGDRVAVEGISPGDTVLTLGNQMVSQGTQIKLTLEERRLP
ncbi:MAG: efflux RND transporter periplasmic adaptor subunit [bacterium]|nr:efflux RND transporter periplasmic adaptor subunit [bacterium]